MPTRRGRRRGRRARASRRGARRSSSTPFFTTRAGGTGLGLARRAALGGAPRRRAAASRAAPGAGTRVRVRCRCGRAGSERARHAARAGRRRRALDPLRAARGARGARLRGRRGATTARPRSRRSRAALRQLAFLDIRMPGPSGLELLDRAAGAAAATTAVVIITAQNTLRERGRGDEARRARLPREAVRHGRGAGAGREGAAHARARARGARAAPRGRAARACPASALVGRSRRDARGVQDDRPRRARATSPVLDHGRERHRQGAGGARDPRRRAARAEGPFVAVNTAAIPRELLESELFGHERGAFTGAIACARGPLPRGARRHALPRRDRRHAARAPGEAAARAAERRGDAGRRRASPSTVDVRIIAATHRDLDAAVREGRFREDLLYRLRVVPMHIPPLRERRDDIALLAEHFVARYAEELGTGARVLVAEPALERLERHAWPGNVRELENAIKRALVLGSGEVLDARRLRVPGRARPPARRAGGDARGAGRREVDGRARRRARATLYRLHARARRAAAARGGARAHRRQPDPRRARCSASTATRCARRSSSSAIAAAGTRSDAAPAAERLGGLHVLADDDPRWPLDPRRAGARRLRGRRRGGAAAREARDATARRSPGRAAIRALTRDAGALFFVNDRFDLALARRRRRRASRPGGPAARAHSRRARARACCVGRSTHTLEQAARRAARADRLRGVRAGLRHALEGSRRAARAGSTRSRAVARRVRRCPVSRSAGSTPRAPRALRATGAAGFAVISAVAGARGAGGRGARAASRHGAGGSARERRRAARGLRARARSCMDRRSPGRCSLDRRARAAGASSSGARAPARSRRAAARDARRPLLLRSAERAGVGARSPTPTPACAFVFGALVDTGFSFAVNVLPIIVFMGSVFAVLYHLGHHAARGARARGGARAHAAAPRAPRASRAVANVFLGMTESALRRAALSRAHDALRALLPDDGRACRPSPAR